MCRVQTIGRGREDAGRIARRREERVQQEKCVAVSAVVIANVNDQACGVPESWHPRPNLPVREFP